MGKDIVEGRLHLCQKRRDVFAGEGWVVVQPYEEVVFQAKE
jgi:ethanolamine utilization protein EutQ (cupin superfamily)